MIGRALRVVDELLAPASIRVFGEQSVLLVFLFHAILPDEDISPSLKMDGSLLISTSGFGRFIDYFLAAGYAFVTPDEVAEGLAPEGRFVLSTFDDGYYNNLLALPLLEEYAVPAAFYISTDHIRTGEAYWWDAVYRMRLAEGSSVDSTHDEIGSLKALTHVGIRSYLSEQFGSDGLAAEGDHDRPMTSSELREFASHRWVHLGNHTAHHAILTNYDSDGVLREISDAQAFLQEVTGRAPVSVSYPNGNHSDEVVAAAAACGLKVGITTVQEPNPLGLDASTKLRLGRFRFDHRSDGTRRMAVFRAAYSLGRYAHRLRPGQGVA